MQYHIPQSWASPLAGYRQQAGLWAQPRARQVSAALRAYAAMTTSADRGAVRDVSRLQR